MSNTRLLRAASLVASLGFARVGLAAPGDAAPAAPATTATAPAAAPAPAPDGAPAAGSAPTSPPPAATPSAPPPAAPAAAPAQEPHAPPADNAGEDALEWLSPHQPSALEGALSLGPSVVVGAAANPQYNPSLTRVGVYGELALAYRSNYFLDPFIGLGYGYLASGEAHLPSGPWGAGGTLKQGLKVVTLSPGITADFWRFRPRFGIGLAFVTESYGFLGQDHSSTQTPLMAQLGLGFNAYNADRYRIDVEGRAVIITGAEVSFGTLDVVFRGDLVRF